MAERDDPFYVGYLEQSPPVIAARIRLAVAILLPLAVVLAVVLVMAQSRFDPGAFEYGVDSELRGLLVEQPYPLLLVPNPDGGVPVTHYLVASGKHGAGPLVSGLDGEPVVVTGSLIHKGHHRMLEVHAVDKIEDAAENLRRLEPGAEVLLGRMTLVGEIVDSKCHLGVMKPGRGKPHKACAIRCISGGIPPVLRVQDPAGRTDYLLLVASDGGSVNREVLEFVAEPIEISGEVIRRGDLLVLYADPANYRLTSRGPD